MASATAAAPFDIFFHFFKNCIFLYKSPNQRIKLGFKNLFHPPQIRRYFWDVVAVHGLRLSRIRVTFIVPAHNVCGCSQAGRKWRI